MICLRAERRSMTRRAFLQSMAGGLFAMTSIVHAQQARRLYRIGWLHLGKPWALQEFRSRLAELGWVEGQNISIEGRFADNDEQRLPALAADLVARNVDVIVTQTTSA